MRIALWRYGLPFQTENESSVGGGLLAHGTLNALQEFGSARVLAKGEDDLSEFDAAVVLTGPFNVMYGDPVYATYRRLASLRGRAIYAQWDNALPFHFRPESNKRFASECPVRRDDLMAGKQWSLLTQVSSEAVRSSRAASTDYANFPFRHVRCLWELMEAARKRLSVRKQVEPAIAYFGSDRPGRLAEFRRWFCWDGAPPVHLYGRWNEKNRAELTSNVQYLGPVKEAEVASKLNGYAMTLYIADAAYVREDFVAQRFFENATAGVPTFYSNKLQPSVRRVVPDSLVLNDPLELAIRFDAVVSGRESRASLVRTNRASVDALVEAQQQASVRSALEVALS